METMVTRLVEQAFGYYGPLRSVWVARNRPGFAFVESEDPPDAADAVPELDGENTERLSRRVELSNGEKGSRNRGAPPSWGVVALEMIIGGGGVHLTRISKTEKLLLPEQVPFQR